MDTATCVATADVIILTEVVEAATDNATDELAEWGEELVGAATEVQLKALNDVAAGNVSLNDLERQLKATEAVVAHFDAEVREEAAAVRAGHGLLRRVAALLAVHSQQAAIATELRMHIMLWRQAHEPQH